MSDEPRETPSNFIQDIIREHNDSGRFGGNVITRFPPEPNGYLHIGHAEAISIDFGMAQEFGGRCHLRFDDTNPTKESQEYVDAIIDTVRWLGYDWGPHLYYASDYFEQLYAWAVQLVKAGKAYVDDLTPEQMSEYRGTLTEPGRQRPYRHRPLYDWYLDQLGVHHPQQIEFARLNVSHTVTSKRKLLELVEQELVSGWDDPRMPTLVGLRRRGYTPEAIRDFCHRVGVAKAAKVVDIAFLEHCLREDLNRRAERRMAVLRPLKLVIENYPEGQVEALEAVNNPEDPAAGTRKVPFSRVLYIDVDDFRDPAPPKYFRLSPGVEVRLRYAYIVKCTDVERDSSGQVTTVRCTYDPDSRGGDSRGRKVKGTIHWVSASHSIPAEVRLYDHLFTVPKPDDVDEWRSILNPNSLEVVRGARLEPALAGVPPGSIFQFERQGYFCVDLRESTPARLILNRTVGLRDTWAKIEGK